MVLELTLSILKPDAVEDNVTGAINQMIEESGLKIVAQKRMRLSEDEASVFYGVHADKPFFNDLIEYITSGPVVIQVLEGEDAITKYRTLMGATDPKKASPNTIRAKFGKSIELNAVHGSDSDDNASFEIALFFSGIELL